MLKPFDGKPFGRKPLGSAAGHKTVSEEDKALERLEQAGSDLVQLFRGAVESLASEIPASSKKRAAKTDDKSPNVLTPPQLAKEWGLDVDKIYAFIRSNELRATNLAIKPGQRARYKINRLDAEDFQRRRQNLPRPPVSPRRKRNLGGKGFY